MDYFAVIDTETNWDNEVMSIGVVIAEKDTFKKVDDLYFIFIPEYKVGGMFSRVLAVKEKNPKDVLFSREESMEKIKAVFKKYDVKKLFAYNASFDRNMLRELNAYRWYDIMRIAAYRQHNDKISDNIECCRTGRMKRNYGVEPMIQLLTGNCKYMEVHNALYDALDELEIMRLLGKTLEEYNIAEI